MTAMPSTVSKLPEKKSDGQLSNARGILGRVRKRTPFSRYPYWPLYFLIASLAAVKAPAQDVVVTLLPSSTSTNDTTLPSRLSVTDADREGKGSTASWLYFRADALPSSPESEIDIKNAQLSLVRVPGVAEVFLSRGMFIKVASAEGSESGPKTANFAAPDSDVVTHLESGLTDSTAPKEQTFRESTVPVQCPDRQLAIAGCLVRKDQSGHRYIGLLLMPSGSKSRRVYYGLTTEDSQAYLQPRLIITYSYKKPPAFGCTSQPSAFSAIQSDGRLASTSSCDFIPKNNIPAQNSYAPYPVASGVLPVTPVVYGNQLFVVREKATSVYLEALKPLGGEPVCSLDLKVQKNAVPEKSLMVVDRFGRLRIVTADMIYTVPLKADETCPDKVLKQRVAFGETPTAVVPGPDGTLYIVSKGIFALNPDLGSLVQKDSNNPDLLVPRKLWWTSVESSEPTKITLSPDGSFVYALAKISRKNKFLAINAQTGKDVEMVLPDSLESFRNPVVARHKGGSDYVFIAANTLEHGEMWAIRNVPDPIPGGDLLAIETLWSKQFEKNQFVGQPILGPFPGERPDVLTDLSKNELYFLLGRVGKGSLFTAYKCGAPTQDSKYDVKEQRVSTSEIALARCTGSPIDCRNSIPDPVADASGNVMFWADTSSTGKTFYGYSRGGTEPAQLFGDNTLAKLVNPRLLFGPAGTLYAVEGQNVTALVPLFTLGGARDIYSPSNLLVKGTATAGPRWNLSARGGVVIDNGFEVKSGAQLSITVKVSQ
jgi:hypothetical protein